MWFCPGANHAPHHARKEYADKYKGKFDDGYEAYREWVLPRMIEKGDPARRAPQLTPINPMPKDVADTAPGDAVRPWNSLNADEKKLFCRMAEVYAGFSEYTDVQVGRIIDYLEKTEQLDNTIIFYCADNGASGEGSPNGSVNENKFFNGYPDDLAENLKYLDKLGGPDTYNHYPTGWAVAFSTPFQMFKRYSQYCRRHVRPAGHPLAQGHQGQGRGAPPVPPLDRHRPDDPRRLSGSRCRRCIAASSSIRWPASRCATASTTPTRRRRRSGSTTRCSARAASGRTAGRPSPLHAPISGKGHFDKDRVGALPRRRRSLRVEGPGEGASREAEGADRRVVRRGGQEHRAAARRSHAGRAAQRSSVRSAEPPRDALHLLSRTRRRSGGVAVNIRGRSYKILADVERHDRTAQGVIFAHGSRFGGHALFIKDRQAATTSTTSSASSRSRSSSRRSSSRASTRSAWSSCARRSGKYGESLGKTKLYVDDKVVAEGPMRAQSGPVHAVRRRPVRRLRQRRPREPGVRHAGCTFTGGTILGVAVDVGDDVYLDLEKEAAAAFARD